MRLALVLPIGLAAIAWASGAAPAPVTAQKIDPPAIDRPDFLRNAGPENWVGLTVRRQEVSDGPVTWRLWRIASKKRPKGPLWVVPHDNENAAFAAALVAVRKWGGTMVAVDSGGDDTRRSARYVQAGDGSRLDPNRSFTTAYPAFVAAVLGGVGRSRPIIALHTNAAGFDPTLDTCGAASNGGFGASGSGGISIRLCNATYSPRPARDRIWPWDDDDSVVIAPYLAADGPGKGWCQRQLTRGNLNVTFERVGDGDGSLSNLAAVRGLKYLNFETRDRGSDPQGIAAARDRMTAMIDAAIARCVKSRPMLLATADRGK